MLGIGIKKMRIMMEKKLSKTAIKSVFDMDENKIKILFICHGRRTAQKSLRGNTAINCGKSVQ